jgi:hypothetical protein
MIPNVSIPADIGGSGVIFAVMAYLTALQLQLILQTPYFVDDTVVARSTTVCPLDHIRVTRTASILSLQTTFPMC